jgi:glyoxylase-like metal-dependent hydrolase (beta-lactamase superfamily II)
MMTHLHYDHCVNWPMFPHAKMHVGAKELDVALSRSDGDRLYPEFTVRELARHPRLHLLEEGETSLPGISAFVAPGHTMDHLVFVLEGTPRTIFSGDVAKNRAELTTGRADMTLDAERHARSIAKLNEIWRSVAKTVLIPGHDVTLALDSQDRMIALDKRTCGIEAWFGRSLDDVTSFDLTEPTT